MRAVRPNIVTVAITTTGERLFFGFIEMSRTAQPDRRTAEAHGPMQLGLIAAHLYV
jgi:hypothetical protein